MTTQSGTVSLHCVAQHAAEASHQDALHLLIETAIAQLKRMPEYRTGQRKITVAADALCDQQSPIANNA